MRRRSCSPARTRRRRRSDRQPRRADRESATAFRIPDIMAASGATLRESAPPTARVSTIIATPSPTAHACCLRVHPAISTSKDLPRSRRSRNSRHSLANAACRSTRT
jgi:hypothetical protein